VLSKIFNNKSEDNKENKGELSVITEEKQNDAKHPSIFLIDFSSNDAVKLEKKGLNVNVGSFGTPVEVPNTILDDSHRCLLNHSIPPNLHEYNIVIINMCKVPSVAYDIDNHTIKLSSHTEQSYFLSQYPATIFNPRPFTSMAIRNQINKVLDNGGILVVFAGTENLQEYLLADLHTDGIFRGGKKVTHSNYNFSSNLPPIRSEFGKEVSVLNHNKEFNYLLNKYLENIKYNVVFDPHDWWLRELKEYGHPFMPLIENIRGELISFYRGCGKDGHIIVVPQISNKISFLEDLLTNTLPSLIPNAFPQYSTFSWLKKEDYILPNEPELITKMETTKIEYEKLLAQIQEEIDENHVHFEWLHKLITGTDYELVAVVKEYLEWLGFENVIDMDEINTDIKEEDLQIETDDELLVIEVKGIGGTSKDSECSQVGKIVGRRMREKDTTKVHGLYIVNHQRFQEPVKRTNPPFTDNQIKDAEYESRGLLTTYALFNLYFSIENGVFSKEEAREHFFQSGLIQFIPNNSINLGKPQEIYHNGEIIILNINVSIKQKDDFIIKRNGKYLKMQILEIKHDNKTVTEVSSGEIGFKMDGIVKRNDEIYYQVS
jgi:hypothetical protein